MRTSIRKICLVLVSLMLLSSLPALSSCKGSEDLLLSSDTDLTVVMKADGYDVPYEIYRYVAESYRNQYRDNYGPGFQNWENGDAILEEFENDVESMIKKLYTTPLVCRDYGLDPDSEVIVTQVDFAMDDIYASYDYDYRKYMEDIEEYNMNDSVYRFLTRNDILAQELMEIFISRGIIKTDETEIREVFGSDKVVRIKNLLISATNGKSDEENRKLAEELLAKLEAGADFESLLKQYGEDLYMFNNPDGYYIVGGNFIEEFEDLAYSLEVGEISGILETASGYSIMKRYEKEQTYLDEHYEELRKMYITGTYNLMLADAMNNMVLEKTEEFSRYQILKRAEK